ncbi:hypothetical protein HN681_03525 [archaeon]|jgi:hypothetical protein|nr:hypothetical protein [archaeon]MBT4540273.1 hypothetical protein [Candidatus Woesearchaeota archaeon]MBT3730377.1 hypothetical protein [archaeon]MBT5030176.1 hypothetical protein [archaeon]MBT5287705.1 hypothetical protein [archaeon]
MRIISILLILLLLSGFATAECFDSDNGKNKYEFGGVTSDGETYQDTCEGENIQEYYCSVDEVASYTILPCVNGCEEGICQIANEAPKSYAAEGEEETNNTRLYLYIFFIVIIIGLYLYYFKWKRRK